MLSQSKFQKLFQEILSDLNEITFKQVDFQDETEINTLLKGINLAAVASKNDLWTKDILFDVLEKYPAKKFYLILNDKTLIGTISIRNMQPNITFLSCFSIFTDFQKCGFGTNSMKNLINLIKQKYPKNLIQLNVFKQNIPAINLYKKLGFKQIKQLPTKYLLQLF